MYCGNENTRYGGRFFRLSDIEALQDLRLTVRSQRVPGTFTPDTWGFGIGTEGRRFRYLFEQDGVETARVYWEDTETLTLGILIAPDDDIRAAVKFWEG